MNKGQTIREWITLGLSNEEILTKVETTVNSIRWHRSKMSKTDTTPIAQVVDALLKPVIELKKVDLHERLSEETPCYCAQLFIDGKHFADLRNDGHGGPDYIDPPKGVSPNDAAFNASLKALEERVGATYPSHDMSKYDMEPMKESLEVLCHTAVWEFADQKRFRSQLSRTVLTFEDGKVFTWKGKKSEELMNAVAAKKPNAIVLNRLTFAEAWDLAKQAA